jgi:hypothetical protein
VTSAEWIWIAAGIVMIGAAFMAHVAATRSDYRLGRCAYWDRIPLRFTWSKEMQRGWLAAKAEDLQQ